MEAKTESIIQSFYSNQVQYEWRRLVKDAYHRLEFSTTLHFLDKYLPPGGLILDAGGGPGRYTLELARRGYEVVLLDLTPENLEFAQRRARRAGLLGRVRDFVIASITDLSRYPDSAFDAVLCTGGPLSHVLEETGRERAIAELARVARPRAPLFISVMSRLSVLTVVLTVAPHELGMPHFQLLRDTGDYYGQHGFTACHFFLPEELQEAVHRQGLGILVMAGLEGLSSNHRKSLNRIAKDELRWQNWLETHLQTCTHPSVVGTSEHMLVVCRKN
jgi:SAM-dependent methyltransferase